MDKDINEKIDYLLEKTDGVFYAKALSFLAKEKEKFENNQSTDYNQILRTRIDILISNYRNFQYNLLKGKSTFDVVDALGACMVFDIKQAKNVLYHASIYSSVSRQISFQTLLDDIMISYKGGVGIPHFNQDSRTGQCEITIIDKDQIEKDLFDTHFKGHAYKPNHTLKQGTIFDYYTVGKRMLRFLKYFDWSITKKDILIFYITLTQISKEKTNPLEIDITREKINNIFISNENANRMFCALINISRSNIKSVIDLRDSLSEYFFIGAGLSSSTLRKYLSEDVFVQENAAYFEKKVKAICNI